MKVANISETDRGGAGLSALKLHKALLRRNIDSRMYVNRLTTSDTSVSEIENKKGYNSGSFSLGQYSSNKYDIPFTTGFSSKSSEHLSKIHADADVTLLRWVSVTVPDLLISKWSHSNSPLVWCLSDMAPLTGGCHYSMGCDNYQISCSNCPMLEPERRLLPQLVHKRRSKLWENIVFVSPSHWLANIAKQSAITKSKEVHVIQTGVELDIFHPKISKYRADALGLDSNKKTILFGAASVKDPRKGFNYLVELIGILNQYHGFQNKYQVLIIGNTNPDAATLPCKVISTGHVNERDSLAQLYSLADITVLPYIEDNLPNACLEALACGTPVVAFAIGGLTDVLINHVNGMLVSPFDVWEMSFGVKNLLDSPIPRSAIRKWAESNIDINVQAERYEKLFVDLLKRQKSKKQHNYSDKKMMC